MSIFPTNLGWFGLVGRTKTLVSVLAGHTSADEVRRAARRRAPTAAADPASPESASHEPAIREENWCPELRRRLERYCLGEPVEFDDFPLHLPRGSDFYRRVLKATRRIPFGQTLSYGDLAEKAGSPRAARAVGTVMSSNQFPIVVPCHRVVAAGNKPGGYTSPQGIGLKLRLLALEAESRRAESRKGDSRSRRIAKPRVTKRARRQR